MDDQAAKFIDVIIKVFTLIGGVVGFIVAYRRYVQTQRWKILEFVASEIKEFDSIPEVQKAKKMLDWWEYLVELFPGKEKPSDRRILVTDEIVITALRIKDFSGRFSEAEVEIRNIFDTFFDYLDRFDNYIESGLVTYAQFHPYLGYWLAIITGERGGDRPSEWRGALMGFIETFHSPGTDRLVRRFLQYAQAHSEPTAGSSKSMVIDQEKGSGDAQGSIDRLADQ